MGKGKGDPVGWRYYLTLHMGVSRKRNNELVAIKVGDKDAWSGSITDNASVTIDKPDLFGGDQSQGGIKGTFTALFGALTQTAPAILQSIHGALVPGFRRVTTAIFDGLVCSNNPTPQAWAMRWRRSTAGWPDDTPWYPEKAKIVLDDGKGNAIHAMNGAHILYETAIDRDIGKGLDRGYLDDASFRAAADTLYAESFGMCLWWMLSDDVKAFQQLVANHIGAAFGLDYTTGKVVVRLLRADYDPATLPLFTYDSGLVSIEDDTSSAQQSQPNRIVVKYHDPVTDQDQQVAVPSIAAIQNAGGVQSETIEFRGLPTQKLALQVGQREVMTRTAGLRTFKVRLDRRGYALGPGKVFRVSAPDRGIDDMVLRCFVKTDGSLATGELTFTATQDLYGLGATTWIGSAPSEHVPPDHMPHPAPAQAVMEAPYALLAQQFAAADLAAVQPLSGYLVTAGVRPAGFSLDYVVASMVTGEPAFVARGRGTWSPSGVTTAAIGPADTAVTLTSVSDLAQVQANTAALIDNEIVRIVGVNVSTGVATIARGCADTVPAPHAAGARLYCIDPFRGSDRREYLSGETVQAKLLTHTPSGDLALADAPTSSVTLAQRQYRPYPPAGLKIGGVAYPATVIEPPPTLTWVERNRLTQADQLIDTNAATIAAEAGTTYTLRLYLNNVLKSTTTAIAGTSQAMPNPGGYGSVRVEIDAVRGGLASRQPLSHAFDYRSALAITTTSVNIPNTGIGTIQMLASGGSTPYTWAIDPSTPLPSGVTMDATGLINYDGTQSNAAIHVTFHLTDASSQTVSADLPVVVKWIAVTRFWRIKITARGSNANTSVLEMQLRATSGGSNLATGGAAFASSVYSSSFAATYAFDGNTSTRWAALGTDPLPYYLGYNLSSASAINEITVTAASPGSPTDTPTDFTIQSSADSTTGLDGTWTDEWSVTGQTGWTTGETRTFTRP